MSEVVVVDFGRDHLNSMAEELKEIIYSYAGRTSLAEVIDILDIVKHEIIEEAR